MPEFLAEDTLPGQLNYLIDQYDFQPLEEAMLDAFFDNQVSLPLLTSSDYYPRAQLLARMEDIEPNSKAPFRLVIAWLNKHYIKYEGYRFQHPTGHQMITINLNSLTTSKFLHQEDESKG